MSTKQHALRTLIMVLLLSVVTVAPVYAGSAVIGSVAGSLNATVGGQALLANTVIFSGDSLAVKDGAAVIALEDGNRMAFGRDTEASFLRDTKAVEVLLGRGDVSMYQASNGSGLLVKAGDYEIAPAAGYKTLGEVAMLNGLVTVTSKEGTLKVNGAGQAIEVAQGKTVTLGTKSARAPMPQTGGSQKLGGGNGWAIGAFAAGTVAAILAGISISRADDAKTAANNATSAANQAAANANSATSAAAAADSDAIAAGQAANASGCALNNFNNEINGFNPVTNQPNVPSPYTPPSGFTCPGLSVNPL